MPKTKTKRFVTEFLGVGYKGALPGDLDEEVIMAIFKVSILSIIRFLVKDLDHSLPLPGIGTFYLQMSPPRCGGVNTSKLKGKVALVPHLKWRVSKKISEAILEAVTGYSEEKVPAKRAPVFDLIGTDLMEDSKKMAVKERKPPKKKEKKLDKILPPKEEEPSMDDLLKGEGKRPTETQLR